MNTQKDFNGYTLTKFAKAMMEREEKMKLSHFGFYMYLVEKNNKLRWAETFGLPRNHTMIFCKISPDTYYKLLHDCESFGLIRIIDKGKNQNQAAIITLQTEKLTAFIESRSTKKHYPTS